MISLQRTSGEPYSNCISLGWFCGTASSLSKLGLRSHSSPFDWCLSHYWAVLKQIEDDFQDFMKKENLEVEEENNRIFNDKKYGFRCPHDIRENFDAEYNDIYKRYCRRVDTFKKAIVQPTVFFRCIRNQEEVDYINEKWDYAEKLLKSFNTENRIIYLYRNGLEGVIEKVQSVCVNIDYYIGKTYEMRHMFDKSEELLNLCARLLPIDLIQKNIVFDISQNAQKAMTAYINKCIEEHIDGIDELILKTIGVSKDEGIYLWGAGKFGIPLAHYLKERDVIINGIVDNKSYGREIEGFNIISFEEVTDEPKIFIAVSNKDANVEIERQILAIHPEALVFKYQDLYKRDLNV